VLVTGGTGTLGRLVVARLRAEGRDVRVLSRHRQADAPGLEHAVADLSTGDGLSRAVAGCRLVVHCAGSATGDADKARRLVGALAASAGRPHVVNISVVGADRVPVRSGADRAMYGYFGQKREAEKVIAESGLPWTTLRATQFHDLVLTTATMMTRLPVVPVPGVRFQPIDASEVADRMAGLALGPPSGLVPEMGGPRTYLLADLLRSYWRATGTRRVVVPVRLPGGAARAFRGGANLSESRDGGRTWEQFLSDHVARTAPPDRSADAARRPADRARPT
jgi:uncharacterized protein YbjT (DUF2867 family)